MPAVWFCILAGRNAAFRPVPVLFEREPMLTANSQPGRSNYFDLQRNNYGKEAVFMVYCG